MSRQRAPSLTQTRINTAFARHNTPYHGLSRFVIYFGNGQPLPHGSGVIHNTEGVDLLPANIELSGLEVTLVNTMSRETILREYLKTVQANYDVILLDCYSSLGMLTINALAAAAEVLIPAQAQYLFIKGLEQLMRTIETGTAVFHLENERFLTCLDQRVPEALPLKLPRLRR